MKTQSYIRLFLLLLLMVVGIGVVTLAKAVGSGPSLTGTSVNGRAPYVSTPRIFLPIVVAPPDLSWFLAQHDDLREDYFVGQFGVDNHPSGWDRGAYLRAYIDMYEVFHDVRILRDLDQLLTIVADGNDILTGRIDDRTGTVLPGWGTRAYRYGPDGDERYSDMLTNALYAYPLAAFARIVKEDENLQEEFGADADRYYQMVADLYEAHAPFVPDQDSPYGDGTSGVYFAYPDNFYDYDAGEDYSGLEAPINWTVIIAEPLVELYRASRADGEPNIEYRDTVIEVANYIWWNMHFETSANGDTYLSWYYWPADPDASTRMEDLTHGARLAEFVVSLHDAGLQGPWSQERMEELANTFTCGAVIGDATFANYIDGTGGVYEDDPATLYEWLEVQKYSYQSSCNTIAYHIRHAMEEAEEDSRYNIAVFAKFARFGRD